MSHSDDAIRRALSPDDLRAYEALGREPSPFEAGVAAFRSQHVFFSFGGWIAGFAMFVIGVYAAWQAWQATDLRTLILWASVGICAVVALGFVKIWFWMEMQKNNVVREVKRLELQVVSLINRLERDV
jgi:hypothetical protein